MTIRSLIEVDFPAEDVSEHSSREKSIRHGHISTLQQWFARRPLGMCRAALFATLCPSPAALASDQVLLDRLRFAFPECGTVEEQLLALTAQLAAWESAADESLLGLAEAIIVREGRRPVVVDTFAGGGSIPLEALRLGTNALAGELNPVAAMALEVALCDSPGGPAAYDLLRTLAHDVGARVEVSLHELYPTREGSPLAYFWARTYQCPHCGRKAPLVKDWCLARGRRRIHVVLGESREAPVSIVEGGTNVTAGTVDSTKGICAWCHRETKLSSIQRQGEEDRLGQWLYAKLVLTSDGRREYRSVTDEDLGALPNSAAVTTLVQRLDLGSLDPNGIRHTWAMQYGIDDFVDLYNGRQLVALSRVADLIQSEVARCTDDNRKAAALLTLAFNRLLTYGSQHAWWQSNGEFPASMYTKQAIQMVWNYVEVPLSSPGAGGWGSATTWLEKVILHLSKVRRTGRVWCGDAAQTPLPDGTVDLVAIDPPYYDSIAYSYLADPYYAWDRRIMAAVRPEWFSGDTVDRSAEAIVDRRHSQAPDPKGDDHFRAKMAEAFTEARRILNEDGRLLIMFGHKKLHAWAAILEPLLDSGFVPVCSWPIHSERKAKFRHSRLDSLSSSCVIVCDELQRQEVTEVAWEVFELELEAMVAARVPRLHRASLFGSDLAGALMAPTVALYARRRPRALVAESSCIAQALDVLLRLVAEFEAASVRDRVSDSETELSCDLDSILAAMAQGESELLRLAWSGADDASRGLLRSRLILRSHGATNASERQAARAALGWLGLKTRSAQPAPQSA